MRLPTDGRHADRYIPRSYRSGDKKNNNKPVEQTHYCIKVFSDYHAKKSLKSICYLKIYIKVYRMHKTNHA